MGKVTWVWMCISLNVPLPHRTISRAGIDSSGMLLNVVTAPPCPIGKNEAWNDCGGGGGGIS